ncbi:hypothetical protein OPT61_g1140 [Boeremia exigua]|uniref:Uncharacterized protein n=1 Tax=Boeremia exigua TaxID=749465 RepID=A0ACC2IRH9_9PLEO|nr:hypothetical protein OPT61_g1140 [Boeremia exigua]
MGGNLESVAGYGQLSLGQAVHIAQNSDSGVDQRLAQFLEKRLAEVWAKLNAQPTSYVLPADEFALLNYYRPRFGDNVIVKDATKRFWDNHKGVLADFKTCDSRAIPLTTALPVFLGSELRLRVLPRHAQLRTELHWAAKQRGGNEIGNANFATMLDTRQQTVAASVHLFNTNYGTIFHPCSCHATAVARPKAYESKGEYAPPDCAFNRVVFNFTVTSAGRQFDRLALMFLDDIEIFRTSTAEPTKNGIVWSYNKDMSSYLAVFRQPHKIILDLGNLVDDTYTGSWQTTLTATFFSTEDVFEPADVILPVSARKSPVNAPSHFTLPESRAVNTLTIPQNARKAVFSISACGQADEEFWWSNVLTSDKNVFGADNELFGHSPFRELQLFIDGQLAGVAWPFPVIFTGGVVPGFWRPVVGIDAFDLLEDEIDVTPFLSILTDNKEHSFEIRIVGIEDDGNGHGEFTSSIESNWVVTGKLFIWLDIDTSITTGSVPAIHDPHPSIELFSRTTDAFGDMATSLEYSVRVNRTLQISSVLQTSRGLEQAVWTQSLAYSHQGIFANKGNDQDILQNTTGLHTSANPSYRKVFTYPLWVASSYAAPAGGLTIDATMRRGKSVEQIGDLAFYNDWKTLAPGVPFRGSKIVNSQNGTASYINVPSEKRSYGSGSTEQHYLLSGIRQYDAKAAQHDQVLYQRDILAVNGSVLKDREVSDRKGVGSTSYNLAEDRMHDNSLGDFAAEGIRALRNKGAH